MDAAHCLWTDSYYKPKKAARTSEKNWKGFSDAFDDQSLMIRDAFSSSLEFRDALKLI